MAIRDLGGIFIFNNKQKLIENLTGVDSSKLNYYLELKKQNKQMELQNNSLEILHQLAKDINIDMSLGDIIKRVYQKLPLVINCDFMALALLKGDDLKITATVPRAECMDNNVPRTSLFWRTVETRESGYYHLPEYEKLFDCGMVRDLQLIAVALIPLIVRGKAIGVLMLGSKARDVYDESQSFFIQQLAAQLAIYVENAKLYEEVLRSKNEWEKTFWSVTDPIFMFDLGYNIIRSNERMRPLNENPGEESWRNKKCYELLWNRQTKCDVCFMDEAVETRNPVYRKLQLSSGQVFDVSYYPVYNTNSDVYAVIHHIKDITEKARMEEQLSQSGKLAAIGEMAAGVAHELNSPMTVIIGNAQMLLRDMEESDPSYDLLKDIVNCGLRCKKIIQNLLIFSRQEERPMGPTDLNEVVERVLSLIHYQINRNSVDIKINLAPDLPKIKANGHQLDQVLLNLLLNARDALDKKEGEKVIEISTGVVSDGEAGRSLVLAVKDNGEGIKPDRAAKIFNPFYTSKETTKGTGLGLSVSLGIAQAHGGTINVESSPGEGSVFSLVLPLCDHMKMLNK
ncbi:two-component sensor histidine kinase [Desulfocucumis palustris]|uniref:histidine kinase n=1 Tax=Desulfocucumis palustris TaxID=1898651 RepID=A0A2L2XHG9_9FIRM|nr:ATP-binding protein [Desulfocucumis palustris]GBF35153.1 two-component sensor histidine kinase [Desulfocucumis palustris]